MDTFLNVPIVMHTFMAFSDVLDLREAKNDK